MEIIKSHSTNVEKFQQIYAEDRFKARIYAFENSPSVHNVHYNNVSTGKFQIFDQTKRFGVSKTMKLYASKKINKKIIVNKTTFYLHTSGKMMPVTIQALGNEYQEIFESHFSWVRFLYENNIRAISFNTIVRHKLYSRDKCLRFMYGCSYEKAKEIMGVFEYREWKIFRKQLCNLENLNPDLFQDKSIFIDAAGLAYKMNQTINAAWSFRRLKEEHDKWAKEYTELAFELSNRELIIHPIFLSLNDYLGGGLLTTTKELAIEGRQQRHCVASYSNKVDSGRTAIFNIDGYTAEVVNSGSSLYLQQYKGYKNIAPPKSLYDSLKNKIVEFSKTKQGDDFRISKWIPQTEDVELPF